MSTLTSTVVDFRERDTAGQPIPGTVAVDPVPYYRVIVCPPNPEIDQPFKVTVMAGFPVAIDWPYTSPTGPTTAPAEALTQRLNLTGRTEIELEYPAKTLTTIDAVNDLVTEALSIDVSAGAPVDGGRLVLGRLTLSTPRWGTVDVAYQCHAAKTWSFPGEPYPEEYVLRLTSGLFPEPVDIVINITDPAGPAAGDPCTGHGWSL